MLLLLRKGVTKRRDELIVTDVLSPGTYKEYRSVTRAPRKISCALNWGVSKGEAGSESATKAGRQSQENRARTHNICYRRSRAY